MRAGEREYQALRSLLGAVRDGIATAEEQQRINDLLAAYPELQQYYVEFTLLSVALHGYRQLSAQEHSDLLTEQILAAPDQEAVENAPHVEAIRAKAQFRLDAFLREQEALRRRQAQTEGPGLLAALGGLVGAAATRGTQLATWTARVTTRLAAAAVVILVALAVVRYALGRRVVARLDEQVHARWAQAPEDPNLRPGPLVLEEGFARITLKQGAQVLVQAPCAFDLRSANRMTLTAGTVTARIPPRASGFTVRSPQATVTDFGTEFGLQVGDRHPTEVHVFQGRVQCRTATQSGSPSETLDITQNHAGIVSAAGGLTLAGLLSRPNLFLREIPDANTLFGIPGRRLDLADVVGGGSGYGTGTRYACIDPVTGTVRPRYRHQRRPGGGGYVPVPRLGMVDGVFVPPAQGGPTQVDSAGHHCDLPPCAAGSWWVEIGHAGLNNPDDPRSTHPLAAGRAYGQGRHPAILMHANLGLTFDLEAVRAALGGARVTGFAALCALSRLEQESGNPVSEFLVLVDGRIRFQREVAMRETTPPRIDVPLTNHDRFLTLVSLAGRANQGDWGFFGDAALTLAEDSD